MDDLKFKVSSGLKNIIGRELITDKTIAIFELVKNSYDAGATKVDISFNDIYSDNATIVIADDGCGMSRQDLVDKWLFVAYSEKKKTRQRSFEETLRNTRTYAGAKGVGRFSCDRLGSVLKLFSKVYNENETNLLEVNWDDFEKDETNEFIDIGVKHTFIEGLPNNNKKGTVLVVENLREEWTRNDIYELKKSLVKLINPYESEEDLFEIILHCEDEKSMDQKKQVDREKINGKITNYVFETLNLKTTQITVAISKDGNQIKTQMFDRGVYLFELVQKNEYLKLKNVKIVLFYLNRSAKLNFRKVMGVSPKEFGSIFIYKNGFRTMPYGEPESDLFSLDRRKTQGYNRFLGTRDLMGRIEILGDNNDFIETSSRDGGLIKSEAYDELMDFYMKYAHITLEKYVVNLINWGDEVNEIVPKDIKSEIIKYITSYEKKGQVIRLDINKDLYEIVEEKKDIKTDKVISELKEIAVKYQDEKLVNLAQKVETENKTLKKERNELEILVDKTSEKLEVAKHNLKVKEKQNIFLRGLTNPKFENATESLHLMNTYAKSINLNTNRIIGELEKTTDTDLVQKIIGYIYEIVTATQKIDSTYTFAFSADYDLKKQIQKVDLYEFITQYIDNALFARTGEIMKINVSSDENNHEVVINPMEFSIILENIIFNSFKARAKTMKIKIDIDEGFSRIIFTDDGVGLDKKIDDTNNIFELGFSTTKGTGVGLAQAKKFIVGWGGTIKAIEKSERGFTLELRLKNEYRL